MRPGELRALPSSEAVPLLHGLSIDSRTHTYMVLTGQTFQGSQSDLAVTLLAQLALSMTREQGAKVPTLPNPYLGAEKRDKRLKHAEVPEAEKRALTERLRALSAIPD